MANKLYIDGKLVDCSPQAKALVDKISSALGSPFFAPPDELMHHSRECLTLPTYFCPHCAREAMRRVAPHLADPLTMFAGPLKG